MNVIKFCFVASFLGLVPAGSQPVAQPSSVSPSVLHILKDFPGIISFGPIFISSVKRGLFTDQVLIQSWNGYPEEYQGDNSNEIILIDENGDVVEVGKPLIPVEEENADEEDEEDLNDVISDGENFSSESRQPPSGKINIIEEAVLNAIREKQLNEQFENINQEKDIPDEFEQETSDEQPSNVSNEKIQYDVKPLKPKKNINYGQPYTPEKPQMESTQSQEPLESPLRKTRSDFRKEQIKKWNSWYQPTSPEIARSISEYIKNYNSKKTFQPCSFKDSTEIAKKHEKFIKAYRQNLNKKIQNYFNGVKAYSAKFENL